MRLSDPSTETPRSGEGPILDLLGVGFGPANLALAVAMEEAEGRGQAPLASLFLEAKDEPAWHPDMMLEGSLIQITVLKDLITVVNPQSRFTFLNYLKEKDRLFDFLNLRDLFPSRYEFNDYLGWVAKQLDDRVRYGHRVCAVRPLGDGDEVELLEVVAERADGSTETFRTRNLVVATGGRPVPPPDVELPAGGRAFLGPRFLSRMRRDFADRRHPWRFVVVGSGQSGAEIFDYLIRHYPEADVTAAIRRFAYKPVDESDFTNRVFFPEMVDTYYNLSKEKRREFFDVIKDVNYAVVDHPLIKRISRTLYEMKVEGRERARVRNFLRLDELDDRGDKVVARFTHLMDDRQVEIAADAVILATGYAWDGPHPLLSEVEAHLAHDADGDYSMRRDYSIAGRDGFTPRVYLQGHCEASHGIGETVLSLLPVRARDILESIYAAQRSPAPRDALTPA